MASNKAMCVIQTLLRINILTIIKYHNYFDEDKKKNKHRRFFNTIRCCNTTAFNLKMNTCHLQF